MQLGPLLRFVERHSIVHDHCTGARNNLDSSAHAGAVFGNQIAGNNDECPVRINSTTCSIGNVVLDFVVRNCRCTDCIGEDSAARSSLISSDNVVEDLDASRAIYGNAAGRGATGAGLDVIANGVATNDGRTIQQVNSTCLAILIARDDVILDDR